MFPLTKGFILLHNIMMLTTENYDLLWLSLYYLNNSYIYPFLITFFKLFEELQKIDYLSYLF